MKEVNFKEEMKTEPKESLPLLSSPEKTPEGEPTSSPVARVLANRPKPASSELDNPPSNLQATWGHADLPCYSRGRS